MRRSSTSACSARSCVAAPGPTLRSRNCFHSAVVNFLRPSIERIQHVPLGQLDRPQGRDGERPAVLLLGNRRRRRSGRPRRRTRPSASARCRGPACRRCARPSVAGWAEWPGNESVLASSRAEMMSMILTVPVSRARALNSSSSPLRTARSQAGARRSASLPGFPPRRRWRSSGPAETRRRRSAPGTAGRTSAPGPCGRCSRRTPRRRFGQDDRVPVPPFSLPPSPGSSQGRCLPGRAEPDG